ncbi:periplasmic serine proteinase DO [hydrothermal vent metagenome]|uniref:Periplasmic serine proteinase DO n=1 Tax=hydrothermal vent metagenome TaxID=652676 RepID=A0A3B1DPC0_9ZZZZ
MKTQAVRWMTFCLFSAALLVSNSVSGEINPSVLKAQQQRVRVVKKVAPSVVAVFGQTANSGGSGVLISADGYALTNFHVTKGAGDWMRCGLNNGKLYYAVIVSIDPTGDVALIKLLGRNDFPFAKLGDSDKVRNGDWVYAMGNPFLLATDFSPTVTYGVVSGVHRYQYPSKSFLEYTDCIQIDTSINPGNSGGPLFNKNGELIGINGRGSFEKRGRVNSGAGYAISINQIKHFMGHLKSGRILDHAILGASVVTGEEGSIVVGSISESSEAYRRGLRIDDELITFAGRPIDSVNQYKNILGIYPAGWKLPIVYRKKNRKHKLYVRLRSLHRKSELTGKPKKGAKPPRGRRPNPKVRPPAKYKHMLVKKPGYANYYFNKLAQDRLLKVLGGLGDYSKATGTWTLSGKETSFKNAKKTSPVKFTLSSEKITMESGGTTSSQSLKEDADLEDKPRGTGGLLAAMQQLKLLLSKGNLPEKEKTYFEFYYLGTEPLDGSGDQVDVLVTTNSTVTTHWYFKNNKFIGFDNWLEENGEECVVRFTQFKEFEGREFPSQFTVSYMGKIVSSFDIENIKLSSGK